MRSPEIYKYDHVLIIRGDNLQVWATLSEWKFVGYWSTQELPAAILDVHETKA